MTSLDSPSLPAEPMRLLPARPAARLVALAGAVEDVHVDLMPIGARRLLGVLDAALSHRLDDSSQQIAPRVEWADPALQCRYADQAHLVRDVRCLAGVTPTEVARETFLQDADAASV